MLVVLARQTASAAHHPVVLMGATVNFVRERGDGVELLAADDE